MTKLRIMICLIAYFGGHAASASGNAINATIHIISIKNDEAAFEITLTNNGRTSIYVEESQRGLHDLHTVSIEIETESGKWIHVGPKMDAAASSVFELRPSESVSRQILVYRLRKEELDSLKLSQPKYKGNLRYFPSEEAWMSFAKSIGRLSKPSVVVAAPEPKR